MNKWYMVGIAAVGVAGLWYYLKNRDAPGNEILTRYDLDGDGYIDRTEYAFAVTDYFDGKITKEQAELIADYYYNYKKIGA